MAVPKKGKSKSCRDMRRSHHAVTPKTVIACPSCGEAKLPHHVCPSCGAYKGREVVKAKESNE